MHAGFIQSWVSSLKSPPTLLLVCGMSVFSAGAQTGEFRGWFADGWGANFQTAAQTSQFIADARAGNLNAIVPEVRRRGDAFYNSRYEPKCTDMAANYDALGDLVAKAHATTNGPRLEVHAWMVTYHVWKGYTLPPQPTHPLNLHPDWLLKDTSGTNFIGGEYTFDPGHPEVQKHTFNVCMDIITNYDVDGLNFDYIRYSSTSEGYNDVTVARFNRLFGRTGLPSSSDVAWTQFRRDQVTGLLRKVYLNAIAVRPQVKISCDTITWYPGPANDAAWYSSSAAWRSVLQDWRGWMEEGILDLNLPMAYFDQAGAYTLDWTNWCNFARDHRFNRHASINVGTYLNYATNALVQLRYTRATSPSGNSGDGLAVYDYGTSTKAAGGVSRAAFISALTQPSVYDPVTPPIFGQAVTPKPMPWKTSPTKGHLKGTVFGGSATNALDGAVVRLSGGASRAQTNDATGFYGFVDLVPGIYTVWAAYPGYGAQTNTVTITAGVVTTADIFIGTSALPLITTQPQSQFANPGNRVSLTVSAAGSVPLVYQWRWYGTNLPGATTTTLTLSNVSSNNAGPYAVVVTNALGAVTSQLALLVVKDTVQPGGLSPLWSLAPGARTYLTTATLANERGMACDWPRRRLLLVSRNGPHVYVLDADTGADLHELNVNGITGGTYPLLLVGMADDGAVYAGNLTVNGSTTALRLYRWADDNPGTVPSVAFSGDPSPGNAQRWGDTLDVRGAGANTQLILASRSGTNVVLLSTADGTSFTAQNIRVVDAPAGSMGLGLAFGPGNTFWSKATSSVLRQVSFNPATGTGSSLRVYADPAIPNAVAPLGVNLALNVLAGINVGSANNHLRVYDLTTNNGTPVLIATSAFPTDNDNSGTGTGAVDFGGERIYALCANNGLLALQLVPPSGDVPPGIFTPPQSQTVKTWTNALFSVTAAGTTPLAWQWRFNGANIVGATTSGYTRTNLQTNDSGSYSVVVTNLAGSITSAAALLLVLSPAVPHLETITLEPVGFIQLTGSGDPGSYTIQVSTNLTSWQDLASFLSSSGAFEWHEPQTNGPCRFYRTRWSPQ